MSAVSTPIMNAEREASSSSTATAAASDGDGGGQAINPGRGRGGRGRGGRGRGRGSNSSRNRRNHNDGSTPQQQRSQNQNQTKNTRGGKSGGTIHITSSDFQSNFHVKLCQAARYKVHAPLCSCAKVVKLRQRYYDYHASLQEGAKQQSGGRSEDKDTATGNDIDIAAANVSAVQGSDVEANFTNQLSRLNLEEGNSNNSKSSSRTTATKTSSRSSVDPFDNLIVIQDSKSPQHVYVCANTNQQMFRKDATSCEKKMAREIFGTVEQSCSSDKVEGNNGIPPFKVNCAICLLTQHQRNGFVAIVSQSMDENGGLRRTIQRARENANSKQQQQKDHGGDAAGISSLLHADHAHFVCSLRVSSLQSLLAAGKTRSKNERVNADILQQLIDENGVDYFSSVFKAKASSTVDNQTTKMIQIKMGHHLASLLWLFQSHKSVRQKQKKQQQPHDGNVDMQYIMVLGYVDSPNAIELDLPGGKRHLGESTLEGAIREVEEECSLLIDQEWFASQVSERYGGNSISTIAGISSNTTSKKENENGSFVQVFEPQKVKGNESGDAFFVMTPPPPPS